MKRFILLLCLLCFSTTGLAEEDAQSKADSAVANILFDYEYGSEIASYSIDEDGFVNMEFARNTPDKVYGEILSKIQSHADVKGVLASKSGPACSLSF